MSGTRPDPGSGPMVTLVIPARDEATCLPRLFERLNEIERRDRLSEVVLVDNGSTDDTANVARSHGARVIRLRAGTVGRARNSGAAAARGEILAFLDADCMPPVDWLTNGLRILGLDPRVAACGARYVSPPNCSRLERVWETGSHLRTSRLGYLPTGGLFVRASAFHRVGGFTEKLLTGEDADFSCKLRDAGFELVNDPALAVVHTGGPKTLGQLLRQEIWHAQGSRLFYRGGGISWVHLLSLFWLPLTVLALAVFLFTGIRWFVLGAALCIAAPPAAVAFKRGLSDQRSLADAALLGAASATYLAGRTLGRITVMTRWK